MGNEEALISVIVPVYNGQAYLAACIESIEKQTYRNLEIIIVNDGSTDDTGTICSRLKEQHPNIRLLTLHDQGVSAARNAGIGEAKGAFVTFVDADDRLRADMLETLYRCILDTGSDVAGCRFFIWRNEQEWKSYEKKTNADDNDVIKKEAQKVTAQIYMPAAYVKDELLQGNSRCWSKLYRKEALENVRFREGLTIGEDTLFLVSLLPNIEKIAETEYVGYGYFQNPAGTINRKFTPRYMDQIICWELAREEILKRDSGREVYAQATALLIMGIMLTVGKIAVVPLPERKKLKKYIDICHEKLKENIRVAGAYDRLSRGYRLKVRLFQFLPGLYLSLYGAKKKTA